MCKAGKDRTQKQRNHCMEKTENMPNMLLKKRKLNIYENFF